jgi:PadR family transcriptional regulator AphA
LRSWVLSPPELPEIKKGFLTQLAWADQLSPAELEELLSGYGQKLQWVQQLRQGLAEKTRNTNKQRRKQNELPSDQQ